MGEITAIESINNVVKKIATSSKKIVTDISNDSKIVQKAESVDIDKNMDELDDTLQDFNSTSYNPDELNFNALIELHEYAQEQCINQRNTISFDELKNSEEFKSLLKEAGIEDIDFINYADFSTKMFQIETEAYNREKGINKEDYEVSGNEEEYLTDITTYFDDKNKQEAYYNDSNEALKKEMDPIINAANPKDDIVNFFDAIGQITEKYNYQSEISYEENLIKYLNTDIDANQELYDLLTNYPDFPSGYKENQDYTLGDALTFHLDSNGNVVVTDMDYDELIEYLNLIENEFESENKYTSDIVAQFINNKNYDNLQKMYNFNTLVIQGIEETKVNEVLTMYTGSIDPETGEISSNKYLEDYFNQDRFKDKSIHEIYQAMLSQGATLPNFDSSFYELEDYMDEESIAVFIYIYGTQGGEAAKEYLELFAQQKEDFEIARNLSEYLETLIDWPEEINDYSQAIQDLSHFISENYDNVTMDWDEFKNSEEFQDYIEQLAYYRYEYEKYDEYKNYIYNNPDYAGSFDEWKEENNFNFSFEDWKNNNVDYINEFKESIMSFDESEELIAALLSYESTMTYNYVYQIMTDPSQVELKNNIETQLLAFLSGTNNGITTALENLLHLNLGSGSKEKDSQIDSYLAQILSQSKGLNIAYKVGERVGLLTTSAYASTLVGGYISTTFMSNDGLYSRWLTEESNKEGILSGTTFDKNLARGIYGLNYGTKSYNTHRAAGEDVWSAALLAVRDTTLEISVQAFIGGIPWLSKSGNYVASSFPKAVQKWLTSAIRGGLASSVSSYITTVMNAYRYGGEINLDNMNEDALMAFIVGTFTTAIVSSGQLFEYEDKTIILNIDGKKYEIPTKKLYDYLSNNPETSTNDFEKFLSENSTITDSSTPTTTTSAPSSTAVNTVGKGTSNPTSTPHNPSTPGISHSIPQIDNAPDRENNNPQSKGRSTTSNNPRFGPVAVNESRQWNNFENTFSKFK